MTPVERMAREIARIEVGRLQVDEHWRLFVADAIAALSALLEPSEVMVEAAVNATRVDLLLVWSDRSPQMLFAQGFRAMIQAAIAEGRG